MPDCRLVPRPDAGRDARGFQLLSGVPRARRCSGCCVAVRLHCTCTCTHHAITEMRDTQNIDLARLDPLPLSSARFCTNGHAASSGISVCEYPRMCIHRIQCVCDCCSSHSHEPLTRALDRRRRAIHFGVRPLLPPHLRGKRRLRGVLQRQDPRVHVLSTVPGRILWNVNAVSPLPAALVVGSGSVVHHELYV